MPFTVAKNIKVSWKYKPFVWNCLSEFDIKGFTDEWVKSDYLLWPLLVHVNYVMPQSLQFHSSSKFGIWEICYSCTLPLPVLLLCCILVQYRLWCMATPGYCNFLDIRTIYLTTILPSLNCNLLDRPVHLIYHFISCPDFPVTLSIPFPSLLM
jgi:hypothetical protein